MGDRVSIAFRNTTGWAEQPTEDSVALFHHWGGEEFPQVALRYAQQLKNEMDTKEKQVSTPLSRLEPRIVMVDFIRWLWENNWLVEKDYNTKKPTGRTNDNIYLGRDQHNGDNSDNGHWVINLSDMTLIQE